MVTNRILGFDVVWWQDGSGEAEQCYRQQTAHRIEGEDVDVGYQKHVTCPEAEQNEEAPHKEHFDSDATEPGPLRLDGDTDAECESEQVEGFELHEYRHQQVNRMVDPAGVRVEVKNVIE
jgi:hypothetical protein